MKAASPSFQGRQYLSWLDLGGTHSWTLGHSHASTSDPFWNDYGSDKCLEAYVSALCISVEFSEHFLVERYHELTQESTLGVWTLRR